MCRDVPYKTLLLSVRETAAYVVREMLDKYALTREDPSNYCLVQVTGGSQQTGNNNSGGNNEPPSEYILEDDECPLSILMNHTPGTGKRMMASIGGSCVCRLFNCFFGTVLLLAACVYVRAHPVRRCYGQHTRNSE